MNKIQFDNLIKPLVKIYDNIELDIIKEILNRLTDYTDVSGSLNWYLEKLTDMGTIDKKTLNILKKNKDDISKVLTEIVNKAGANIDEIDLLKEYYERRLIDVNPEELYKSNSISKLINEALKDSKSILDLINTKALEGAREEYKSILNKAYLETASGIYTYQESIKRALKSMANEGIRIVNYESGKSFTIESTVRRDIVTRVNKLVGDCEIEHAKELKTNLMYVDQHLGARVRTKYTKNDYEAHAEWQGKKYMIVGSNDKYDNLYEKTGYGEMLGLKGINCYHNMRPTWEWEKIPNRIDEIDNALEYKKLQKQRAYERNMRSLKREKLIAKELNEKEELKLINKSIKKENEKYDDWLKDNNLTRDYNREQIVDIKNNLIFEEEFLEEFENLDKKKEHLIYYDFDTGKPIGKTITGDNHSVKTDIKTALKVLLRKKDSLIAVHNHPNNLSFSFADFKTFNNTTSLKGIVVKTDDYIYLLSVGKGSKLKSSKENLIYMENTFNKIKKDMNITHKSIELIHERNKKFAKEMGWKYERIRNEK